MLKDVLTAEFHRKGLKTFVQMANLVKLTPEYIGGVLKGKKTPTDPTLIDICNALELPRDMTKDLKKRPRLRGLN